MKKLFALMSASVMVVALWQAAFAATETVTGKLIDESCYAHDKTATGNNHKMGGTDMADCAQMCAKKGQPVG